MFSRYTKRFLFWSLILSLASFGFFSLLQYLADGFTLSHITASLTQTAPEPSERIRKILSQNFSYIGKGSQCYIFESEDQEYVIKFFRMNRYKLFQISPRSPLPSFLAQIQKSRSDAKKQKKAHFFESLRIAETKLKEESGLIYLHLNKTTSLSGKTAIYDRLQRKYFVDLNKLPFVIQKKGEPALAHLTRLLKEGKEQEAKRALEGLIGLLTARCRKEVADGDPEIHKNAGFRDGKAFFLDIGEFSEDTSLSTQTAQKEEITKITRKLRHWLSRKNPEIAASFEQNLTK